MTLADADLRRAMLWVQRSPATNLRLPALAQALGLSPRTLARRVQAHTGLTAALWMRRIKPVSYTHLDGYKRQIAWLLTVGTG